jgi:hypothetical protein
VSKEFLCTDLIDLSTFRRWAMTKRYHQSTTWLEKRLNFGQGDFSLLAGEVHPDCADPYKVEGLALS